MKDVMGRVALAISCASSHAGWPFTDGQLLLRAGLEPRDPDEWSAGAAALEELRARGVTVTVHDPKKGDCLALALDPPSHAGALAVLTYLSTPKAGATYRVVGADGTFTAAEFVEDNDGDPLHPSILALGVGEEVDVDLGDGCVVRFGRAS